MYTDRTFSLQKSWSESALFLMRDLLPLMAPVATHPAWKPEQRHTLKQLLSASARSTESVLLLCAYGQLWDAELVVRSVLEGSLKFVYLLQGLQTLEERHTEFADDLPEIGRAKDHEKAKSFFEGIPNPDDRQWDPIRDLLLSDVDLRSIREKFNKAQRRELERKWGFSGLISALSNSDDPLLAGFKSLAHGYSIASHLLHADFSGTAIPLERDERSLERRETAHLAHLSRLISDVFTFFQCRVFAGYRCIDQKTGAFVTASERIAKLLAMHGAINEEWMKTEYGGQHKHRS
jgi:hypothetical protein